LGRFVFYLSEAHTHGILAEGARLDCEPPERIMQNFKGGTLAIRRETYFQLGGFDEGFVGWGGEDNEMYDRCRTAAGYPYGYLPLVHLYHSPQPSKGLGNGALGHLQERLAIPTLRRIEELSQRTLDGTCDMKPGESQLTWVK